MLRCFWPHEYRNVRIPKDKPPRLGRINLLVGPNSVGKSNFLKAMSFLPEMLLSEGEPTSLLHTIAAHGRADAAFRGPATAGMRRPPKERDLAFHWVLEGARAPRATPGLDVFLHPPSDLVYFLHLRLGESESFPKGFFIQQESLQRFGSLAWWGEVSGPKEDPLFTVTCHDRHKPGLGKGSFERRQDAVSKALGPLLDKSPSKEPNRIVLPVDPNETVLKQTKELIKDKPFYEQIFPEFERAADELYSFALSFHSYKSSDLSLRMLKEGAKLDLSARRLDEEGSQFVNVLRYLDQQHDFLDEYAGYVRELVPDLKKLKIVDASDIFKQLDIYIGSDKFRPYELSDGTLRAMWLALLLFSPEKGSVLALDEPELSMHPAWLKIIGRWLQKFRSAEQIFVSTHSPDLLDTFTEGFRSGDVTLFVFSLGEKGMHRVEAAELDEFFKEGWELGDLYRIGEPKLGGWPW